MSHTFSVHCMSAEQLYRTDNLIKCLYPCTYVFNKTTRDQKTTLTNTLNLWPCFVPST